MPDISLTRKATLTMLNRMLQDGLRAATAIVLTPFIISRLGTQLYGAWLIIQQLVNYLSTYDLKAVSTLKFYLSLKQKSEDGSYKRRLVGAATIIAIAMLPILAVGSIVLLTVAPHFVRVEPTVRSEITLAIFICIANLAVSRFLGIPGSILRGLNLDYKAMGLNLLAIVAETALAGLFVFEGLGVPGLALSALLGLFFTFLIQLFVLNRNCPWLGIDKPTKPELVGFFKLSAWILVSGSLQLVLYSSDLVMIGYVFDPNIAAIYSTTGTSIRLSLQFAMSFLSSSGPGFTGLCGNGEWERVSTLRRELYLQNIALMAVLSVGILSMNQSFVSIWLGPQLFYGQLLVLLLLFIGFVSSLIQIDGMIVDSLLVFRAKTIILGVGAVLTWGLGLLLGKLFGLDGLVAGILIGRLTVYLGYLYIIRSKHSAFLTSLKLVRALAVLSIFVLLGWTLGTTIRAANWLNFGLYCVAIGPLSALAFFVVGFRNEDRVTVLKRFKAVVGRR